MSAGVHTHLNKATQWKLLALCLCVPVRAAVCVLYIFYVLTCHTALCKGPELFFSLFFALFFKTGLEPSLFRLSEDLLKFFFRHWLLFLSFSVQFLYLIIFKGIFFYSLKLLMLTTESFRHKKLSLWKCSAYT